MTISDPTGDAINDAIASFDALESAQRKVQKGLIEAREKLLAVLKVVAKGAPLLVDKKEAERLLGVSDSTVNRMIRDRILPVTRIYGAVRISRTAIEDYVART